MKNKSIIIGLVVFAIGAVAYSFSTKSSDYSMSMNRGMYSQDTVPAGMHRMSDGALMNDNSTTLINNTNSGMGMMRGMDHSMMMVESEREFIERMIPHHQEAVNTAKEVLIQGGSTVEIKKLA